MWFSRVVLDGSVLCLGAPARCGFPRVAGLRSCRRRRRNKPGTLLALSTAARPTWLQEAGNIPLPEFRNIKCAKCAEGAAKAFGFPFMLKSKT